LPYRWERLQLGNLDLDELGRIEHFVARRKSVLLWNGWTRTS
jgi:hypothetical protein